MTLKLDPEFKEALARVFDGPVPVFKDIQDVRAANDVAFEMFRKIPLPDGVEVTTHSATSLDGSALTIRRFVPASIKNSVEPQRAVIYAFGGGLVSGAVVQFGSIIGNLAVKGNTQYFGVEYRLAPEHPFPAAVEDIYSSVTWLQARASEFGIDPARIILHGQSAGGGLVAGVALMARDKGLNPPIAAQLLKYPMLDDRTMLDENSPMRKFLFWSEECNDLCWEAYLGGKDKVKRNDENVSPYAAPARAKNLSGLPKTLIDIGGLDLFRDEAMQFATGLAAADVDVECHLFSGLTHGYDGIVPNSRASRDADAIMARFIASI